MRSQVFPAHGAVLVFLGDGNPRTIAAIRSMVLRYAPLECLVRSRERNRVRRVLWAEKRSKAVGFDRPRNLPLYRILVVGANILADQALRAFQKVGKVRTVEINGGRRYHLVPPLADRVVNGGVVHWSGCPRLKVVKRATIGLQGRPARPCKVCLPPAHPVLIRIAEDVGVPVWWMQADAR